MSKKTFTIMAVFEDITKDEAESIAKFLVFIGKAHNVTATFAEEIKEDDNGEEEISAPVQESP